MNEVIEEIYASGHVYDETGNEYPLQHQISTAEGAFLYKIIAQDASVHRTLEIGCAQGLSSLFICTALAGRAGARHLIIDPNENGFFKGIGIANLKRAGIDFFELIEERSEYALPPLAKDRKGQFDLVFIDGYHTFDQTMVDLFYANRLLRIGGYIVIDDCNMASVSKAVTYFSKYPAYQVWDQIPRNSLSLKRRLTRTIADIVPGFLWENVFPKFAYDLFGCVRYSSMVALKKVAEDQRHWAWFSRF